MSVKNTKNNTRSGLLSYNVSGKAISFFSNQLADSVQTGFTSISATGGTTNEYIESDNYIYRSHTFTNSGTFTVTNAGQTPSIAQIQYLVVGGGGAGGGSYGTFGLSGVGYTEGSGGGGAGGYLTGFLNVSTSPGSYSVVVGSGGRQYSDGSSSVFAGIVTSGGGGGGGTYGYPGTGVGNSEGRPGTNASGGGGSYPGIIGGSVSPVQFTGANSGASGGTNPLTRFGGGGGGAGGVGIGSIGGSGITNTFVYGPSQPMTYAFGGNSLAGPRWAPVGIASTLPTSADQFTGGGGEGRPYFGQGGGSGVVVIRYKIGSVGVSAKATGGLITNYSGKTIHTFIGSGTFRVTDPSLSSVEYVVVAGGGGGGGWGGGGAGGYKTGTTPVSVSPGSYTVIVGAGGGSSMAFPFDNVNQNSYGGKGQNSSFGPIVSTGGGGGGDVGGGPPGGTWFTYAVGSPGGSGGGGGRYSGGGSGIPGEGFPGASGTEAYYTPDGIRGGGGGGAAGAGNNSLPNMTGGSSIQLPATFRNPASGIGYTGPGGSGQFYVAGGGGGTYRYFNPQQSANVSGGGGGAGNGFIDFNAAGGTPALQSSGSGGGGGNYNFGGSGIVLIAYPS